VAISSRCRRFVAARSRMASSVSAQATDSAIRPACSQVEASQSSPRRRSQTNQIGLALVSVSKRQHTLNPIERSHSRVISRSWRNVTERLHFGKGIFGEDDPSEPILRAWIELDASPLGCGFRRESNTWGDFPAATPETKNAQGHRTLCRASVPDDGKPWRLIMLARPPSPGRPPPTAARRNQAFRTRGIRRTSVHRVDRPRDGSRRLHLVAAAAASRGGERSPPLTNRSNGREPCPLPA